MMTLPLYLDFPLVGSFPAIELSIFLNSLIFLLFALVLVDLAELISSGHKIFQSIKFVICPVLLYCLPIVVHIFLDAVVTDQALKL